MILCLKVCQKRLCVSDAAVTAGAVTETADDANIKPYIDHSLI